MARVLIVDDDPLMRKLVTGVLTRDRHELHAASSAAEALRLCEQQRLDVVLVDFHLPDLNGLEVLRLFREAQPACIRMLVTGSLDLPMAVEAVNRGEVGRLVEKPVSAEQLRGAVADGLASRERMVEVLRRHAEGVRVEETTALDRVLSGDLLFLAVQPIVHAHTARPMAYEALLRSRDPVLPDPLSVLRVAEVCNRLSDLAAVVVARAYTWRCQLPSDALLFINLHPDELADPTGLAERLEPLAPFSQKVVLEITERSRLQSIDLVEASIDRLRRQGFRLAVDDLGSGYSSLAALADLRPEFIKIDMGIVRSIDVSSRKQRLVELLCKFADTTESVLIAEGVETEAEAEALRACGAHWLQGYRYGYPSAELPS
jgi:EAL domain-containing protein (putative c-di-GMP-specific phosphodiesterase class I)